MKTTKRALGQRNKNKTIKYFQDKGYSAVNCELNKICYFGGRLIAVHKDLLGSDAIIYNKKEFWLVQCKSNKVDISKAKKEFAKYDLPAFIGKMVVCWERGARKPIIIKELNK